MRVNVAGWLTLADVCAARRIHLTVFGTGCGYSYDDGHPPGGKTFCETEAPNQLSVFYTRAKTHAQELMELAFGATTLLLKLRVPISDTLHPRSFLTKIATYDRVVDIPNSVSVLHDLLPLVPRLARANVVGPYNFANPGAISHHEVLRLYKEHIEPDFVWKGMTYAEQRELLGGERGNNELDVSKLLGALPGLSLPAARDAVEGALLRMRRNAPESTSPEIPRKYFARHHMPTPEQFVRRCASATAAILGTAAPDTTAAAVDEGDGRPLLRVVVVGNGSMAARGLELMCGEGMPDVEVPFVVAHSDDPGTDGWRESLVKAARGLGFVEGSTLLRKDRAELNSPDFVALLKAQRIHCLLSLQCRYIIGSELASAPAIMTLNVHNGPLPLLRGCDPFAWAIADGMKFAGQSLHQIPAKGVDDGAVFAQRRWPIRPDSTAYDLYRTSIPEAVELLRTSLVPALRGELPRVEQDLRIVTYHPMGQFDYSVDSGVDWNKVATTVDLWLRARIFPPIQVPQVAVAGTVVRILRCRKLEQVVLPSGERRRRSVPGEVAAVSHNDGALVVGAKWGFIALLEVALGATGAPCSGEHAATTLGLRVGDSLVPRPE